MPPAQLARLAAIGLVAGIFSAVFGVGGGIVVVPLLMLVAGFQPHGATATSLGAIAITALSGAVAYGIRGDIRYEYAALVGVPAVFAAIAGAAIQRRISAGSLSLGFAGLLVAIGVWLILG